LGSDECFGFVNDFYSSKTWMAAMVFKEKETLSGKETYKRFQKEHCKTQDSVV